MNEILSGLNACEPDFRLENINIFVTIRQVMILTIMILEI